MEKGLFEGESSLVLDPLEHVGAMGFGIGCDGEGAIDFGKVTLQATEGEEGDISGKA